MNAKLLTPETTMFESVYCGRCGGSGKYSFNLMHGDRCYGCGGQGVKLTKRGKAASNFFRDLCSKPAGELTEGDVVEFDMFYFRCWSPITRIEKDDRDFLTLHAVRAKTGESISYQARIGSMIRLRLPQEKRAELIEKAKAYQASLTKAGTPRVQN